MKLFISIFIIFIIAIRPVLPLVNYAINYDYIVKNLCENRDKPQSTCKGKCYVEKELAKTEKQSGPQTIKISVIDVFLSNDILSFADAKRFELLQKVANPGYIKSHSSDYFSRIFHPPLG
ncbi:hypothetical protein [Chryseobacterium sp. LAM-KRS1]|uniref:hypothetical protein n=1 Tax=Chryseobacterium sp. LAM-KRS1 TaxID=2715754 RepID=UPI001555D710|nr:hypothetical protein [Chryseobacterium sp. LAM-KRS1]